MLGDIKEHMDVIASDGNRIGRVDHVKGDQIELAKMDLDTGFKHRMIPTSWIDHVDDHVHLNLTEDQAKDRWTDKQEGRLRPERKDPGDPPGSCFICRGPAPPSSEPGEQAVEGAADAELVGRDVADGLAQRCPQDRRHFSERRMKSFSFELDRDGYAREVAALRLPDQRRDQGRRQLIQEMRLHDDDVGNRRPRSG